MQVTGEEVPYDSGWELSLKAYVVMHFLLVLRTYHDLFTDKMVRICRISVAYFQPCVFEAVDCHPGSWLWLLGPLTYSMTSGPGILI